MDQIKKQVARARRRLIVEQFLGIVSWTLFVALTVAAVGLAVSRFWLHAPQQHIWFWLGGGLALGLGSALLCTYVVRRRPLEAAIEVDRRFGLKERISSSLALAPDELQTEAGRALVDDAIRRVERIEVADQFKVRSSWLTTLPLLAALVFVGAVFVPNVSEEEAQAAAQRAQIRKQVHASADKLRKKIAERQKRLAEKGLVDATDMLKRLQEHAEDLQRDDVQRKEAMVRLNDMAKELAERRKKLGSTDEMKKQMERLKDLKSGPADKIAKAMQEGDFGKAMEEMKALQAKLASGEMDEQKQQELADQLDQMREKFEQMKAAHEQAKQELKEKIQQKRDAGDLEGAEDLQRQLDMLSEQDSQMNRLMDMANQLGEASDALRNADSKMAAQQLDDLLDQLQQMQMDMDELQELSEMLDELSDVKSSMNCKECGGLGCPACQGGYGRNGMMNYGGFGLGEGRGQGERPEAEDETGSYNSKVAADLQRGAAVRVGPADGPNKSGRTRESIKEEIEMSISERADAMQDQQRLPRDHRDHVGEYFQRFVDEQ